MMRRPPRPHGGCAQAREGASRRGARSTHEDRRAAGRSDAARPPSHSEAPALDEQLLTFPDGFTLNRKLAHASSNGASAAAREGEIDWGSAEALAFASLLDEGTPIRLTGQDTRARNVQPPPPRVPRREHRRRSTSRCSTSTGAKASFEVYNSPLSEYACLGFEYGYSARAAECDGVLGSAVRRLRQRRADHHRPVHRAGAAKWGQTSRLTLLLPHGYEGAGPEHSSARIERFLQLSAEGNMRLANCSTAAQYFHLLRRQAQDRRSLPAGRHDAEVPAAQPRRLRHARRAADGRSARSSTIRAIPRRAATRSRAVALQREDLLRSDGEPALRRGEAYRDRARRAALAAADRRRSST